MTFEFLALYAGPAADLTFFLCAVGCALGLGEPSYIAARPAGGLEFGRHTASLDCSQYSAYLCFVAASAYLRLPSSLWIPRVAVFRTLRRGRADRYPVMTCTILPELSALKQGDITLNRRIMKNCSKVLIFINTL